MWFSCSAEVLHVLVFWLSLVFSTVFSPQRSQLYVDLSPASPCNHDSSFLQDMYSLDPQIYIGLTQILEMVQMFVLGPRLILGVREYHAELVANSDTASAMTSIVFEERVHVSTSSSV